MGQQANGHNHAANPITTQVESESQEEEGGET